MKLFIMILLLAVSKNNFGQNKLSNDDSLLIGTWKGTSICQIRPSACNDEIAAYHIMKGKKPNTYHIIANKVINGKEEDMGESDFVFDPAKKTLVCVEEKYKILISFNVNGDKMDGTLEDLYDRKKIIRVIKLAKASSDQ